MMPLITAGLILSSAVAANAGADELVHAERGAGILSSAAAAEMQGQGQARGQSQGQGQGEARGQERARPQNRGQGEARGQRPERVRGNSGEQGGPAAARGRPAARGRSSSASPARRPNRMSVTEVRAHVAELPPALRRLADSPRRNERMAVGAVARGKARGLDANDFDVRISDGTVRILNGGGALLVDLDEDRARELGVWQLRRMGDRRPSGNAPSFCRSGAGHPVWGREWCLDKGFGLGSGNGTLWSRGSVDDVIYRRTDSRDRLDRGGLIDVVGDIIFGRLALHAVSLGLVEPLTGVWVAEPNGPRLLRVRAGDVEVAEFVDADRDGRVEVLYVVQPRW
jgi:hypothetical protein